MRRFHWVVLGLLIVVLGGGTVLLWPDSGPIVAFATVGKDPWPLVVDAATSRAFVYNRTDGTVSTINTVSGALLRTVSAGSQFAFMAVDQRTHRLFVSSGGDDTIYMLDARSGVVLHHVTEPNALTPRQPVVDEQTNRVFVGHRDPDIVTMLDARSGVILRDIGVCSGSFAMAVSARTGHIFAKCNDGTTDMLDGRTGRVLRTISITPGQFGFAFVDEYTNRVFVSGSINAIDVLDARTGTLLHTITNVDAVTTPFVDERTGRVYAALGGPGIPNSNPSFPGLSAATSQIAVLDGWTGRVLHRIIVMANPTIITVDSHNSHILVGSVGPVASGSEPAGYGVLSVVDAASGATLRRVSIGILPADMAIDARTGHVLVDNETVDLNIFSSGSSGALTTSPPETGWARTKRHILEGIKHILPSWLPFKLMVPPPPSPPTRGTVTTLDLARL